LKDGQGKKNDESGGGDKRMMSQRKTLLDLGSGGKDREGRKKETELQGKMG